MLNKKSLNVEIGSRIKEARESAGLTQERFAELIGMGTKMYRLLNKVLLVYHFHH